MIELLKEIYHTLPMELWEGLISLGVMGIWIILVFTAVFLSERGEGDQNEDLGQRNSSDKKV